MNSCPKCGKLVRANGSAWKCDFCKWPENESYVQEELTPSLSLSTSSVAVFLRQAAEARQRAQAEGADARGVGESAGVRRRHTRMNRWKKSERPPHPKIEDCPQPLRRHLEEELSAQIEKHKRKYGLRSVSETTIKILTGVAWRMVMTPREERRRQAIVAMARRGGRKSVIRRMQYGILESQLALARMKHMGKAELRRRKKAEKQGIRLVIREWVCKNCNFHRQSSAAKIKRCPSCSRSPMECISPNRVLTSTVILRDWTCRHCDHHWKSRQQGAPERCPHCYSSLWNRERKTLTRNPPKETFSPDLYVN